MLFDEGDSSLLKKWIVKRLEDISDADSDVLAEYVLALLRHDQPQPEVKSMCIEQLDDFLREHTSQFVEDVFAALNTKSFLSANSTVTTGGLSVSMPDRQMSPSRKRAASPQERGPKRSYYDRDAKGFNEDELYGDSRGGNRDRGRGSKMPRRGANGSNRWTKGGIDPGATSRKGSIGALPLPSPLQTASGPVQGGTPTMPLFPLPPPGAFPWIPPPSADDPVAAYLAAQAAAAAWGTFPPPGIKLEEKRVSKKIGERCKDYDEKGFCMKGDMCPYEHGVDHIVVPGQEGKEKDGSSFGSGRSFALKQLIPGDTEYDPNEAMIFSTSASESRPRGGSNTRGRGSRGRGGGRTGRSEHSATGPSYDKTNTKLVVENVPNDKLTDSAIKEFFSEFGIVSGVEIQPNKHLAILTFAKYDMAKAAYDSPTPIFNNRFVKVFWFKHGHNDSSGSPITPTASNARRFSTDFQQHKEEEEQIDIEEVKRKQEELQKVHEEKMAKKKANEEAAKALQKRTEELLKLQQEEKRKLMEKLAKKQKIKPAPNTSTSTSPTNEATANPEKSKADATTAALKAQLEALQAEAQALGIDSNPNEEDNFDLEGFRGRGRGRGRFPSRGRGAYVPRGRGGFDPAYSARGGFAPRGRGVGAPTMKLDNRTKKVAVTASDLKGDREEEFRHYLINNGIELEAIQPHPDKKDTQIFTFKDRRNAEKFVFSGNGIPNVGTVSMAWHNAPLPVSSVKTPSSAVAEDGDTRMGDAGVDDDAYDLAEDDEDRWLPE